MVIRKTLRRIRSGALPLTSALLLVGAAGCARPEAGQDGEQAQVQEPVPPALALSPLGSAAPVAPPPLEPAVAPDVSPETAASLQQIDLTDQIRRRLQEIDHISAGAPNQGVRIETEDGRVTLSGVVANGEAVQAVVDAVRDLPGVQSVDNQLQPATAAE